MLLHMLCMQSPDTLSTQHRMVLQQGNLSKDRLITNTNIHFFVLSLVLFMFMIAYIFILHFVFTTHVLL